MDTCLKHRNLVGPAFASQYLTMNDSTWREHFLSYPHTSQKQPPNTQGGWALIPCYGNTLLSAQSDHDLSTCFTFLMWHMTEYRYSYTTTLKKSQKPPTPSLSNLCLQNCEPSTGFTFIVLKQKRTNSALAFSFMRLRRAQSKWKLVLFAMAMESFALKTRTFVHVGALSLCLSKKNCPEFRLLQRTTAPVIAIKVKEKRVSA